ncbi:hypothetical protein PLESTB_000014500 [Pleodorina starrii]|uniref:Protein kinase domain-containing protein n=1 Tax=Pleodorina starrii TaxID=330485 RepID=A0A9W6B7Z0_9CHLO|nr:hypothetical protein PLESTB_000014500 [Pleodorina starrii]GLC70909.1 hypothetical protein PLESTF_001045700 [Pleodorina starrii]
MSVDDTIPLAGSQVGPLLMRTPDQSAAVMLHACLAPSSRVAGSYLALGRIAQPDQIGKGVRKAGRPRCLAAAADAKQAANPNLHFCGCDCSVCKEQRRQLVQWRLNNAQKPSRAATPAGQGEVANAASWGSSQGSSSPAAASAFEPSRRTPAASSDTATTSRTTSSTGAMGHSSRISGNSDDIVDRPPPSYEDCAAPSSPRNGVTAAVAGFIDSADVPAFDFGSSPAGRPAQLLCVPPADGHNRTVWWWPYGNVELLAKVLPCHSPQREAEIMAALEAGGDFPTASGRLGPCISEQQSLAEAATAMLVPGGLFVQPVGAVLRPCSLAGGINDAGHDLEVVILYPYHRHGSALDYISTLAAVHAEAAESEDAALTLAKEVFDMSLDMFGLMYHAHGDGFLIQDHKPENMVKTSPTGRYRFIDAEYVQRCRPGYMCTTTYCGTPYFAPPEQQSERWADASSDVHACGRSIRRVVDEVVRVFALKLGSGSPAAQRAEREFLRIVKPLTQLEKACVAPADSHRRPTAAAAFDWLLHYLHH